MNAIKDLVSRWNELNQMIKGSSMSDNDKIKAEIEMLKIQVDLTRLQFEEQESRRKGYK